MQEAFDAIMATDDTQEVKAAAVVLTSGGALRAVMGELKAGGMSIGDILKLVPQIVDLIVQYGPVVAEIVKKVKELFGKQ
jgi:hypothetical protein